MDLARAARAFGVLIIGVMLCACAHRRARPSSEKLELRDHGTACLRVVGGVFQSSGAFKVEATVTAPDRKYCDEFDMSTCTIEQAEHREIVVTSLATLFPPYGRCESGRGPVTTTCRAAVAAEEHEVVFGHHHLRAQLLRDGSPICLGD